MAMELRDLAELQSDLPEQRRQSLVIGPGALSHGNLEIEGDIHVAGTFRGNLKTADNIVVNPAGHVQGDLVAARIMVLGRVSGTLAARREIEVGPEGIVQGQVQTPTLKIAPQGLFDGIWHVSDGRSCAAAFSLEPERQEPESSFATETTDKAEGTTEHHAQYDRLQALPNYLEPLQLQREPFSNSPDPEFFYASDQYRRCLSKIDLAVRLRMGFNVILGEVGTGKTTMCRLLIQQLSKYGDIDTHLFPDPHFGDPIEFLSVWLNMMNASAPADEADRDQLLHRVRERLMDDVRHRGKRIVLLIDEGQKAPPFVLDILCDLNKTRGDDGQRLLQVVIFAQRELEPILDERERLREQLRHRIRLEPLDRKETRSLIEYRIRKASGQERPPCLFSPLAMREVHRLSGGYPRKIIQLCHWVLLTLVIRKQTKAGWSLVRSCAKMIF